MRNEATSDKDFKATTQTEEERESDNLYHVCKSAAVFLRRFFGGIPKWRRSTGTGRVLESGLSTRQETGRVTSKQETPEGLVGNSKQRHWDCLEGC